MRKEKLWTSTFITTSLVNFVLILSIYLLLVTLASYALDTYNTSVSMAGLVASIFIIGVLFGRLYAGKHIDRIGSIRTLSIGLIVFILLSLFYFLEVNIYILILIRILQGIGGGFATTATGTIVSRVIPSSRSGEGIGYFSMSNVLATAVGPLVGVYLINVYGYTSIFIFSTIVGIVSFLLVFFIQEPKITMGDLTTPKGKVAKGFALTGFFEKNAIPISMVLLVVAFAYSGILSFITTFAQEINLSEAGGYYFFVYAIIVLLSRPITGKMMDQRGANSVVYPGLILFAVGFVILSFTQSSMMLLLGAMVIGLGYGNFQSCTQAIAVKLTPIERMGLANSTYFIFLDFALGIGPLILGLIIPVFGFRGLYLLLAGVILASIYLYYFLHGRRDQELLQLQKAQE